MKPSRKLERVLNRDFYNSLDLWCLDLLTICKASCNLGAKFSQKLLVTGLMVVGFFVSVTRITVFDGVMRCGWLL